MRISYAYAITVIAVYFCAHVYMNSYAQKAGNDFYTYQEGEPENRVYDILHENLPDEHKLEWLINAVFAASLIPLLLHFNMKFITEYLGLMLTVYILRDITINLTILPKHEKCELTEGISTHINGSCYDKIFSAHFAAVFILSILYYSYKYITNVPLLVLWNLMNALIIILTRAHYTIDVVVSVLVCYLVYDKDLNLFKLLAK